MPCDTIVSIYFRQNIIENLYVLIEFTEKKLPKKFKNLHFNLRQWFSTFSMRRPILQPNLT